MVHNKQLLKMVCVSLFFICCQFGKKKLKKTRQPASSYRWACCYGPVLSQKQSVNIFFGRVRPNHVKTHGRRQIPWKAKKKNVTWDANPTATISRFISPIQLVLAGLCLSTARKLVPGNIPYWLSPSNAHFWMEPIHLITAPKEWRKKNRKFSDASEWNDHSGKG